MYVSELTWDWGVEGRRRRRERTPPPAHLPQCAVGACVLVPIHLHSQRERKMVGEGGGVRENTLKTDFLHDCACNTEKGLRH